MNSILGALVGDAAGAPLEFLRQPITEELVAYVMKMPGGGRLRVGPGQITDDGELTLAAWTALRKSKTTHEATRALIAAYAAWYESGPFDIGYTCSMAFQAYSSGKDQEYVKEMNYRTEANGALMRASAVATWIAGQHGSIESNIGLAAKDTELSHPNEVCKASNVIYVFAIANLLRGKSPKETIALTDEFVRDYSPPEKVARWYFEESAAANTQALDCTTQIGHVRYGFVLAFHFLRQTTSFEDAIRQTLMKGGDTDTNAAIVGGMVGAYSAIPAYMLDPVMAFDCTREGNIRPAEYSVKRVLG
jgi:ADP-ribosyl-[dinitrogen reductase] hydrolase